MRKLFLILSVVMASLSATAQEETVYSGTKFFDNWYVGLNAGVGTGTTHQALLKNLNPNAGIRLGKSFSPVFSLGLDFDFFFNYKHGGLYEEYGFDNRKLGDAGFIAYQQIGLFFMVNLPNAINGFYGEPRKFDVSPLIGFYWGHNYGNGATMGTYKNMLVNKLGVNCAWNFGKYKEWQAFVEPTINFAIAGAQTDEYGTGSQTVQYNINNSFLQLNVGVNYRFKNSNGAHYFMIANSCDPLEFDELNNTVNELRAAQRDSIKALEAKNDALADELNACLGEPAAAVVVEKEVAPNMPSIFFQVGRADVTAAQQQNVAIVAEILKNHPTFKLMIKGYASPEGNSDGNNVLAEKRAAAVKNMLVNKYKINPSRIKAEGCGATDKLFEIYECNRVAMLFLSTDE